MISTALKGSWWLLPIGFLVTLCFRFYLENESITQYALFICLAMIGVYLLFFKKDLFFSLCILLVPLSVNSSDLPGVNLTAPSELMVAILALATITLAISRPFFFKKLLYHPISILLIIDLGWMLVSTYNSEMHEYSVKRIIARTLFLIIFYLLMAQWVVKKENMLKFLFLYSIGLIIPIIITEYHHSFYGFNPRTVFELSKPFYNDHTIYGACIAFVIPFVLIVAWNAKSFGMSKATTFFMWTLFIFFLAAEILAFSRAAWLSLMISAGLYCFLKLKLRFWHFAILLILAVALVINFKEPLYEMAKENQNVSNQGEISEHLMSVSNLNTDASNLERVNRWSSAIRMYEDRPLTGFGPGTYQFVYGPYQSIYEMTHISTISGDRGNAHSEPLTYLSETGLPGFISYLIWSLATIGFGIGAYHRSKDRFLKLIVLAVLLGFTTFFFHGLVNSFIDQVKMASLVFGSMAIIVVADVASKAKRTAHETEKGG